MKLPLLNGAGAKVELDSGLLYGEDTCAALASWFKPVVFVYVHGVALRVQLRHLGFSSSHWNTEGEQLPLIRKPEGQLYLDLAGLALETAVPGIVMLAVAPLANRSLI